MFLPQNVKRLNDLESQVLDFIIKYPEKVQKMTIRQLAAQLHLSPTTIVRMSNKLDFDGWSELKYYLKKQVQLKSNVVEQHYDSMAQFNLFLQRLNSEEYQKRLQEAAQMILQANYVIFMGIGTSGSLADYACKYFVNAGLPSFIINDPYQAIQLNPKDKVIAFILSVSGETEQIINKELEFKEVGAKIISLSNSEDCTLARLSDLALSYELPSEWSKLYPLGNLTTQLPVLSILELLTHKVLQEKN